MRVAVISDIHGNIAALEAVLNDIARRGVDRIVNLGDCLSGPFDAAATADRLIALDALTVRGNHDRMLYGPGQQGLWEDWALEDLGTDHLEWVKSMPPSARLGDVFLCHATPDSDVEDWLDFRGPQNRLVARDLAEVELRAAGISQRIMLCGHTHTPRVVRLPDGRMIVNPGAVGCPAYRDDRTDPPFTHQTGAPDARYAILEKQGDAWLPDLLAVPYDATEMARLALTRGAESWAEAVTTGWLA